MSIIFRYKNLVSTFKPVLTIIIISGNYCFNLKSLSFQTIEGGSGQRKLSVIPPESEGYTAKILKTASSNGRHVIFIIPLQDEISTEPLPANAPEFSKMPKSQCKTCGAILPLQVLALHVESCGKATEESEEVGFLCTWFL